ncbi:MAG: hypothetical protein V4436_03930 [Patescibacteria group bacterium]
MSTSQVLISPQETKKKLRDFVSNSPGKITFIFGAGASAGYSNESGRVRPPVVLDLLNEKNEFVAEALTLHPRIAFNRPMIEAELANFDYDLESYLSDLYGRDKDDTLFSEMMAYLQTIFARASREIDYNSNNYKDLLFFLKEKRAHKKWSLISFNYDTLLEQSFKMIDRSRKSRTFATQQDYLQINPPVIKIHGGVNFRYTFIDLNKDLEPHDLLLQMLEDDREPELYLELLGLTAYSSDFHNRLKGKDVNNADVYYSKYDFPLMMVPVHGASISKNSFFTKMLDQAVEELKDSELVVAIGYNFGDNTLTDLLKKLNLNDKEIILVGTNNHPESLGVKKEEHISYKRAAEIWGTTRIFDGNGFGEFTNCLF